MKTRYKPFPQISGYYLENDAQGKPLFLIYGPIESPDFKLKIKPHGYIPKSGLFLCTHLSKYIQNKKILEIGTGETGIIAVYTAKNGAAKVLACDIDISTVKWALMNKDLNKLANLDIIVSDIFENVHETFDLIISNPPQMPMIAGTLHDSGGLDGRQTVINIIKDSSKFLNKDGALIIQLFDFLGVEKSFNNHISLFELMKQEGLTPTTIARQKRYITKGGQTEKSIKNIQKMYPKYSFQTNTEYGKFHEILIVYAKRT